MEALKTKTRSLDIALGRKSIHKKFPQPKLLTYQDYVKLTPPDSGNYELRNGKIIFMASPKPPHQEISSLLHTYLGYYITTNKLGKLFAAPMDVYFSENDTFQPDLLFISKERLAIIGETKIEGSPDLVVEILSESNDVKEMGYKKYIYESCGVKEYWLINVEKQTLTQYEQEDNELRWKRTLTTKEILKTELIKGFEIELSKIFE